VDPKRGRTAGAGAIAALLFVLPSLPGLLPVRPAVAASSTTATATTAATQPSVLVLGDSLSAEYGLARNTGWVELLSHRISEAGIKYSVVNASISGETTSGGLTRLPQLLDRYHPSVVVIELGANDGLRGLPITAMASNLQQMIDACRHARSQPMLVGMRLPPNYGRTYVDRFAAVFDQLARDNRVALVPFLLDGVADQREMFQADQLHPIAAAEPQLLDNVWPHLRPLLITR
jgi:acyl-CoA thioesterase I